jgi:hypothetical protein
MIMRNQICMIPKSGNRFSDKIMRNQIRMIPKSGHRFSDKVMRFKKDFRQGMDEASSTAKTGPKEGRLSLRTS